MAEAPPVPKTPQAPKTPQEKPGSQATQPSAESGGPKILLAEAVFMTLVFLSFELVDFIPIIGPIIALAVTQVYLYFKGVKQTVLLVGNALEFLLPGIGAVLPIRTVAFIITVIIDHLPGKLKEVATKIGSATAPRGSVGGGLPRASGAPAAPAAGTAPAAPRGAGAVPEATQEAQAAARGGRSPVEEKALGAPSTPFEEMERPMREVPELQRIGEEPSGQERKAKEQTSEEALGAGKSEFEKMREPMEKVLPIDEFKPKKKESDDQHDLPLAA